MRGRNSHPPATKSQTLWHLNTCLRVKYGKPTLAFKIYVPVDPIRSGGSGGCPVLMNTRYVLLYKLNVRTEAPVDILCNKCVRESLQREMVCPN